MKEFLIIHKFKFQPPGYRPLFVSEQLHTIDGAVYRGRIREFSFMSPRAHKPCDVEMNYSCNRAYKFERELAREICSLLNAGEDGQYLIRINGSLHHQQRGRLEVISWGDALVIDVMTI